MIFTSIVIGFVLGLGLLLIWSAYTVTHPTLAERVQQGSVRHSTQRGNPLRRALEDSWLRVVETLGSTTQSVTRRLELLGGHQDVVTFRAQQLIFAAVSMVASGAAVVMFRRSVSLGALLPSVVFLLVGALVGVSLWDQVLSFRANRRQRLIDLQVPDAADLLALALGAGESVPAALERISRVSHGELSVELGRSVRDMSVGTSTTSALLELAERNDSRALDRLVQTLVTALERGSPLAKVLHDQAQDIRESTRQRLMEEGGKREIFMLFPVVFFILPVTVLFALYPGLAALQVNV